MIPGMDLIIIKLKRAPFLESLSFDTFIGFTIALLPLYIRLAGNLETNRISKDNLFLYLILGSIVFLNGSLKDKYLRYTVAGLIGLTILNQHHPFSRNVMSQAVFIIAGLVFFIKYYEYDGSHNIQHIYNGMIAGALIQGTMGILGYYGINIYPSLVSIAYPNVVAEFKGGITGKHNAVGSFGNYNLSAAYLAMTIPAFLSRRYVKYLAIIPIVALMMSQSQMGIGAFIVGVIFYTRILSKIKMYSLAIAGMLIFPCLNLDLDSGRFAVWTKVIKEASVKHWLMGMGPGWFPDMRYLFSASERAQQEHSNFLAIFNVFGLLGFAMLFPIFYKYLKVKEDDRLLSTILFIIFCNSFAHFSFHQSTALIIIIPILALSLRRGSYERC